MAGDQDSVLRFRIPTQLKERYDAACKRLGGDKSKHGRNLIEGFCEAVESGTALLAPFEVKSQPVAKKRKK